VSKYNQQAQATNKKRTVTNAVISQNKDGSMSFKEKSKKIKK